MTQTELVSRLKELIEVQRENSCVNCTILEEVKLLLELSDGEY